MDLRFADENLARSFREEVYATACWGLDAARQYVHVVNFLTCIEAAGDVSKFAFLRAESRNHSGPTRWIVPLADGWHVALDVAEGGRALIVAEVVTQ